MKKLIVILGLFLLPLVVYGQKTKASTITLSTTNPVTIAAPVGECVVYFDGTAMNCKKSDGSSGITVTGGGTWGSITGTLSSQTDLQTALDGKVPTTTTVNGHALSTNVTVTASDVGNGTAQWNANKINGTTLSVLGTGILKNTTGTGVPSIAVAGDFPTLNQSTTGNAATATALSATPTTCGAGVAATGVLANGNATGCFTPTGSGTVSANNTSNAHALGVYNAAGGSTVITADTGAFSDGAGNVSAASFIGTDTTHAGLLAAKGQTLNPSIPANTFGWLGPASAAFTSYVFQMPATAPTANNIMLVGAPTGNIAQATYAAMPACADTGGNHLNFSAGSITCGTTSSGAGSGNKASITCGATNSFNPAVSTSIYVGGVTCYNDAPNTINANYSSTLVPATGTVTTLCVGGYVSSPGSAENNAFTLQYDQAATAGTGNIQWNTNNPAGVCVTGLSIAVTQGHYLNLKVTPPASYVTAPTGVRVHWSVVIN